MNKIITLSLSSVAALFLTTGCLYASEHMEHKEGESHHEVHWGYKGEAGPSHWGELKKEYHLCSTGKMQTPINIVATEDIALAPLEFNYHTASTDVINNGHTVQINIANGSSVTIEGKEYSLKQFHFHTPSENNINGHKYALEAHFVHAAKDGSLAVVAVMFEEGIVQIVMGFDFPVIARSVPVVQ